MFFSLQYICLKDNCLTDTGILLWSLPHRMFKSGPGLLRTLDLSCNPGITDSCAKCFVKFLHLKSLNLSGTAITITSGIRKIMNQTSLKLVSYVSYIICIVYNTSPYHSTVFCQKIETAHPTCISTKNVTNFKF